MVAAAPSSWEELPGDLLGLVLQNLPSLAESTFYDQSYIRRTPNPLSGLTLHLPKLASAVRRALDESTFYDQSYIRRTYVKVILSSSPLDSALDPLVTTIIMEGNSVAISSCKQPDAISISMRRKRTLVSARNILGMSPEQKAERIQGPQRIDDIAFFHGKLYALARHEGLRVVELDAANLSEAKFLQCIPDDPKQQELYNYGNDARYLVLRYLAESDGRLLMIRRWMRVPPNAPLGEHDRTVRFEVFQADLAIAPGQWIKVDSLSGHAIFLGTECSKSLLASQCAGGVQENSIYFMHRVFDNPSKEFFGPCVDPLADSGVFNLGDGRIMPLLPEAVMAELQSKWQFLTWFFPSDA